MFIGYIYIIRNKINDKKYIGQTTRELEIRFNEHKSNLSKSKHNPYLQNSWNKHGESNFEFRMITKIETENSQDLYDKLNDLETEYIYHFHSMYNDYGFNLREGGNNSPLSEESRIKISVAVSGEKNGFYGKKHTEESKKKIKLVRALQILTRESYEKSSISQSGEKNHFYGKTHTEESRKKISDKLKVSLKGEGNPFYGRHHTEETKQKVRETKRKNYLEKFRKEKGILVVEVYNQLQNGKSNIEIIRELNITKGFLHNVKNKLNYHGEIINEYLKGEYKL